MDGTVSKRRRVLVALAVLLAVASTWVWARSAAGGAPLAPTVTLKLDTRRPGYEFAPGAVGLSTEAQELSSGHLSDRHASLVRLMRLLGPAVLRIGGNSVDFSWWTSTGEPPPAWATNTVTPANLFALRGLLTATGWRVLLGVDLGHFEPARAADEARYASVILGRSLLGIELGNEPNDFGETRVNLRAPSYSVSEYLHEAAVYRLALGAAAPGIAIYGPALSATTLLPQVGAAGNMFSALTQHYYPAAQCQAGALQQPTAAELLSPAARERENEAIATIVQAGALAGRPTRIGETGSGGCNGDSSASSAFASALWALDWSLRAESGGVSGLNFHGHLGVCGAQNQSPVCAPTEKAARVGYVTAQPEFYGLLAASRLEGGRFVPATLTDPGAVSALTTWATLAANGTIAIAIDNMATEGSVQPVSIPSIGYTASEELLVARSAYEAGGIALGGIPVSGARQWKPIQRTLPRAGRSFEVLVRPASAVIIVLRRDAHGVRRARRYLMARRAALTVPWRYRIQPTGEATRGIIARVHVDTPAQGALGRGPDPSLQRR